MYGIRMTAALRLVCRNRIMTTTSEMSRQAQTTSPAASDTAGSESNTMHHASQPIPDGHRRVCVIPEPKHVEVRQGCFVLPPSCRLTCRENRKGAIQRALDAITDALAEREVPFRRSRTLRGGESENLLFIGISSEPVTELPAYPESTPANRAVDHAEGYVLDVADERIAIWASTSVGLFYGVQTLLQLLHRSGRTWTVPCLRIADWPAPRLRAQGI